MGHAFWGSLCIATIVIEIIVRILNRRPKKAVVAPDKPIELQYTWVNKPNSIYPKNYLYVDLKSQEVRGTVRASALKGELWEAYVGGAVCGTGEFLDKDIAMNRVEDGVANKWAAN